MAIRTANSRGAELRFAERQERRSVASRTWTVVRDALTACAIFGLVAASIGSEGRQAPVAKAQRAETAATAETVRLVENGYVDPALLRQPPAPAIPETSGSPTQFLDGLDRGAAIFLLGTVFSAVIAFNLAFLRHLGRVHTSPRPRGRGRG